MTAPGDGSSIAPGASDEPDALARELAAEEGMPWAGGYTTGTTWEDVPLVEPPEPEPVDPPAADDIAAPAPAKESQATTLVRLAQALYELHVDDDGTPWAEAHEQPGIVVPLRGSGALRSQLSAQYLDVHGRVASSGALTDALGALDGYAQRCDPVPVELRCARRGDVLYVDLGIPGDGRAVEVSDGAWRVVERAPVLFRRTKVGRALPVPERGATLDEWRPLLNVDEPRFRLVVGWLLAAYVPDIARPILSLFGQHGVAKTTALRQLVRFVDPSNIPTRSMPDPDAWPATGASSYVIGLDNVSSFSPSQQDMLCKAVTGESVATRALYTNNELATVHFQRAIIMAGITTGRLQGDFADRLLPVELDPIGTYRSDKAVGAAFDAVYARTFGALLDLLARVLAARTDDELTERARMADFAIMLRALDAVTGWTTLRDYLDAHDDAARDVVAADPFATAVVELVQETGAWSGPAGALLAALHVPEPRPRTWPATPAATSAQLRRVIPALAASGVAVSQQKTGHARTRTWTLAPSSDSTGTVCRTCGLPLDPALGTPTHPSCE